MIGIDDQQGIFPEIEFVHHVEHLAEIGVAHAQQGGVFVAAMFHLGSGFLDRAIGGPVEMFPVILAVMVGVEILVLALGKERFVRVERLDLEKPAILGMVAADELEAGAEGVGLGLVFLAAQVPAVDPVLAAALAVEGVRDDRVGYLADPGVAFLAAEKFPGRVFRVVGRPAVLEIMVMIGGEMGVDAVLFQDLRHRVVERFERAPGAMEEIGSAGVDLAAGGHARH